VKVGPLVLHGVDAIVMENDLPIVLLGMSFLSRTEMERDGNRLTLRKRF
jgi:aspartyl protease family protein